MGYGLTGSVHSLNIYTQLLTIWAGVNTTVQLHELHKQIEKKRLTQYKEILAYKSTIKNCKKCCSLYCHYAVSLSHTKHAQGFLYVWFCMQIELTYWVDVNASVSLYDSKCGKGDKQLSDFHTVHRNKVYFQKFPFIMLYTAQYYHTC